MGLRLRKIRSLSDTLQNFQKAEYKRQKVNKPETWVSIRVVFRLFGFEELQFLEVVWYLLLFVLEVAVETVVREALIEEKVHSLGPESSQSDVQQIAIVPVVFDDKFSLKFNLLSYSEVKWKDESLCIFVFQFSLRLHVWSCSFRRFCSSRIFSKSSSIFLLSSRSRFLARSTAISWSKVIFSRTRSNSGRWKS